MFFLLNHASYALSDLVSFFIFTLSRVTEEVINEVEKNQDAENPSGEDTMDSSKENPVNEAEEKEPVDKVNILYYPARSIKM